MEHFQNKKLKDKNELKIQGTPKSCEKYAYYLCKLGDKMLPYLYQK